MKQDTFQNQLTAKHQTIHSYKVRLNTEITTTFTPFEFASHRKKKENFIQSIHNKYECTIRLIQHDT